MLPRDSEHWPKVLPLTITTNSTVVSPFWKVNSGHGVQQIPSILWNLKFHYRVHKSLQPVPILSQTNLLHILQCYFFKTHFSNILSSVPRLGACGSIVRWGTMQQARRSQDRVPMRWIFFNLPNPSSHTMALVSTRPLTEMSTRNLPGGWRAAGA
jgi:hypothetical protein